LGSLGILGILGIENQKPKIVNFSLSKPATTTKKKFQKIKIKINYHFFRVRADAHVRADAPRRPYRRIFIASAG
jgi:hypothetical protein